MLLSIKRLFVVLMLLIIVVIAVYYINPYEVKTKSIMEHLIGGTIYRIPSRSMEATLRPGDYIFVSTTAYQHQAPQTQDVIVFTRQDKSLAFGKKIPYIKRVIATQGEKVKITRGKILINEEILDESYVKINNNTLPYSRQMDSKQVPAGSVFVLGDNRDISRDSRLFGMVPTKDILGKAIRLMYGKNGRSWKAIQ